MAARNPDPLSSRVPVPATGAGVAHAGNGQAATAAKLPRPIPVPLKDGQQVHASLHNDGYLEEEGDDLQEALKQAPAWLASTVFHMSLLIVLGLIAASGHFLRTMKDPQVSIEQYSDRIGEQLIDPTPLPDLGEPTPDATANMITPTDLTPVMDPFATPPDMKIDLDMVGTTIGSGLASAPTDMTSASIGWALSGRSIGSRNQLLPRYGGTVTTEKSVVDGLTWLVKQQRKDGLFSLMGPYSDGSRVESDAAATAMALLALQGHGETHTNGQYSKQVAKAWQALLKLQNPDGLFKGQEGERSHLLYTHAQCTIALCELYAMTRDSTFRAPAQKAIEYVVWSQDKAYGGWRYDPHSDSDVSVTGWMAMALQSARMAGLTVPQETLDRLAKFLDKAQADDGRRYSYRIGNEAPSPSMSAVGLLCRQYQGWRRDDPRLVEGVALLNQTPVVYGDMSREDVYYWYYAAQAAHHMEGKIWEDWNKVMRQEVPAHQLKTGPEAGSWDPSRDKWVRMGGRLYVTCLSICMLEVYYRHLPLYTTVRFNETDRPFTALLIVNGDDQPKLPLDETKPATDPVKQDPVKQDPAQQEPAQQNPPKRDAADAVMDD